MLKEKLQAMMKTIKQLRQELNEVLNEKENLTDEEVLQKSMEMDRLLNEYYRLLYRVERDER